MSLVEELGAQVHGASEDLPLGSVTVAAQRLRVGLELLQWVRQESVHEVGVIQLASATEQLEHAMLALRAAQDRLAGYLAAIGLAHDASPTPDRSWRESLARPPEPEPRPGTPPVDAAPLGHWWTARVDAVTGHDGSTQPAEPDAATDSTELLRRVSAPVRSGDRSRLRRELRAVAPPVGLGLGAITPPVARHLATDLLGHEPTAADLPELARVTRQPVRDLLPGVPEQVLDTLLARICRVPPPPPSPAPGDSAGRRPPERPGAAPGGAGTTPRRAGEAPAPTHPTDPAVTGAVVVGVLLHRLGRGPEALERGQHG